MAVISLTTDSPDTEATRRPAAPGTRPDIGDAIKPYCAVPRQAARLTALLQAEHILIAADLIAAADMTRPPSPPRPLLTANADEIAALQRDRVLEARTRHRKGETTAPTTSA